MSCYLFSPSEWHNKLIQILNMLQKEDIIVVAFSPEIEEDFKQVLYILLQKFINQGKRVSYIGILEKLFPYEMKTDLLILHHIPRHPETLEFLETGNFQKIVLTGTPQELNFFYLPFKTIYWFLDKKKELTEPLSDDPIVQTIYHLGLYGVYLPLSLASRLAGKDEDLFGPYAEELQERGIIQILEVFRPPAILLAPPKGFISPVSDVCPFSFFDLIEKIDFEDSGERAFLGRLLLTMALRPALKKRLCPKQRWAEIREIVKKLYSQSFFTLKNPEEFLLFGKALRLFGIPELAVEVLRVGKEKLSESTQILSALADSFATLAIYKKAPIKDARKLFGMLNAKFPENPYFLLRWARFEAEIGYINAADGLFKEALSLAPKNPVVYANYIDFKLENHKFKGAERLLTQALSIFPENFYIMHLNARYLLDTGNLEKAETLLKECFKKYPKNLYFISTLAELHIAYEKPVNAISILDDALNIAPDHQILLHQKSRALIEIEKIDEALNILEELYDYDPFNLRTGLVLCGAYWKAGKLEDALNIANEFLEKAHFNLPFLHRKAEILIDMGKTKDAELILKDILDQDPSNPFAICTLAKIAIHKDDKELASYRLDVLEEVLKERPLAYLQKKRLTNCLKDLRAIIY